MTNPIAKTVEPQLGNVAATLPFNPEMINTIMRDQSFNPCDFITNVNEKTLRGWRKTVKWTKDGRTFEMTTGEGPMFEESEDEEEEEAVHDESAKIESKVDVSVESGFVDRLVSKSGIVSPFQSKSSNVGQGVMGGLPDFFLGHTNLTLDQISEMYALFQKFNKMNAFAYDLCFLQLLHDFSVYDDKSLTQYIAQIESVGQGNPILETTEQINIGTLANPQILQIATTLNP